MSISLEEAVTQDLCCLQCRRQARRNFESADWRAEAGNESARGRVPNQHKGGGRVECFEF